MKFAHFTQTFPREGGGRLMNPQDQRNELLPGNRTVT